MRKTLRWLLALICASVFLYITSRTVTRYLTTSTFMSQYVTQTERVLIPGKPYNDLTDGGIQARLTLSTNLFQVTLLITAAVAGLLIAKDGEAGFVLTGAPELIMFLCTGLLLLLSFVSHALYLNEISYLYALAGEHPELGRIPDVSNENINFLFNYQLLYFVAGAALALMTFFSAHQLKGGGR
ncbi:MAG TPA: hypothetical protein VN282_00410 [Pyrinomonadaceae bacterium]|nr:hypothetical protein [Pyrinomonadaceae bacterium]